MTSQYEGMQRQDPSLTGRTGMAGMMPPATGFPTTGTQDSGQSTGSAGAVVDQVKDTAGNLVDQAKEQAGPKLDSQKERAVDRLNGTAHALRRTSQTLREQEDEGVARYAEKAAERAERVANYLRERDLSEIVEEVEDFARRQPVLFLGGSFALGLLATRFLRSTRRRESASSAESGARRPVRSPYRAPSAGFPPALSIPGTEYGQPPVSGMTGYGTPPTPGQGLGSTGMPAAGYPASPGVAGTDYGAPHTPGATGQTPSGFGTNYGTSPGTPVGPDRGYGTGYPSGSTPGMEQR